MHIIEIRVLWSIWVVALGQIWVNVVSVDMLSIQPFTNDKNIHPSEES